MKKFLIAILFLILVFIMVRFFFPYYKVASNSMEPTFSKGTILIVNKFYFSFFKPKKGDIVLIKPAEGVFTKGILAHRIIATEGDEVTIKGKIMRVNNQKIQFSNINKAADNSFIIPKDYSYQKGDNPTTNTFGLIENNLLIGKIILFF